MYYLTRDEQCIDGKLRTADYCESENDTIDFRKDFEQFSWQIVEFVDLEAILALDPHFYTYGDELMYINEAERRIEYRATIKFLE